MKKTLLITALLFFGNATVFAQSFENQINSKIDAELLTDMSNSKNDSELFPIIVMMSGQYDQMAMSRKTKYMDKKSRREFVINEMKRFTGGLQADVARVMTEQQRGNSVKDFKQFWIFNGFSCKATKNVIEIVSEREDVAMIFIDKKHQMIPEMEMTSQPADNVRGNAWNITKVNADDVWGFYGGTGYTGSGIVVAVIDTGVNYNHTDIKDNMWDGGSSYPYHGYDFVNGDNNPMDDNGHGSHCAGTVAGYGTNGTQTGIAKSAKIMALKVLDDEGSGYDDDILDAIEFAITNEADVISLSLGGSGCGGVYYYRQAFETVLSAGIPASVAAGNDGDLLYKYPIPNNIGAPGNCPPPYLHPDQKDILSGGMTAVISVGATDQDDVHAYFTSVGPATWASGSYIGSYNDYPYTANSATKIGLIRPDIAAPGVGITSINYANNTGYCSMSGTSMATPCVAGVIALMLEANPSLTPCKIDSILEHTAVRCEGSTKKNNYTGSGRIDAYTAVSNALGGCDTPTGLTASLTDDAVTLTWNAAEDITSYSIFRNNVLIENSVTTTTFTDDLPIYGNYSYYVKSNCPTGGNSMMSNVENVNYAYPGPVVDDLSGNVNGNQVTLSWTQPDVKTDKTLNYGTDLSNIASYNYWAQIYDSSKLNECFGMAVKKIQFYTYTKNINYTVKLYNGDNPVEANLLAAKSFTPTSSWIWLDVVFDNPVYIDCTKKLWVTFYCASASAITMGEYGGSDYENAILLSDDGVTYQVPEWSGGNIYSASVKVVMTGGSYSYNIYNDGVKMIENQSSSSYSYTENDNGFHEYHVTTNYFGRESQPSNPVNVAVGTNTQFTGNETVNWSNPNNWTGGKPGATDGALINNDVIVDENVTINNLIINEDVTVTVAKGKTLTVSGDVENLSGIEGLVIESDAALVTNAPNLQAAVKRDITASISKSGWTGKWHFLSSPVENQSLQSFIDAAPISGVGLPSQHGLLGNVTNDDREFDFYLYHEPTMYWANIKTDGFSHENLFYVENGSLSFVPGRGYLVSYGNDGVMTFEGVVNEGETTIALTADGSKLTGFNLIGNPYPCSIDWNASSGWTRDVLGSSPYIWIYNDDVHQYGAYQLGQPKGTHGVSNIIAPCQGFFVKASNNGNIIIDNDVKTTEMNTFRKINDSKSITINVSGKNGCDEVMICSTTETHNNAEKLYSRRDDVPSLYLNVDGVNYSIVNVEEDEQAIIPMGFLCGTTGRFVITSDSKVELLDKFTGDVTNLSSNSYEFIGSPSDNADRFVVRISDSENDDMFVYQNGNELIINGIGQLQIIDCLGRVVANENVSDGRIDITNLNTGVYVVKMSNRVQKIVLK